MNNKKIVIYSSNTCTSCKQLKEYLNNANVEYDERNIDTEENYVLYFSDKLTKSRNYEDKSSLELPAVVINDVFYPKSKIFTDGPEDNIIVELFGG